MKKLITLAFVMSLAITSLGAFANESHNSDDSLCNERRIAESMDANTSTVTVEEDVEVGDQ